MWSGLLAMKVWMPQLWEPFNASAAVSMSSSPVRARETTIGPFKWWPISRTLSKSPGEAAAKPASMVSTPSLAS